MFSCPTEQSMLLSHIQLFATLWTETCQGLCSLRQWCHPAISSSDALFSFCPQSFPALGTSPMCHLFTSDDWSFSVSMCPSSEYSGLISLKIDWFDLLAVQGTFRSLLQHHSPKASILWRSAFFMVQLSKPYMTTGKTRSLTTWTFVNRVMSLLFSTRSRFVIAFPLRSKLSSDFMAAVTICSDFWSPRKKISISTFPPSICMK